MKVETLEQVQDATGQNRVWNLRLTAPDVAERPARWTNSQGKRAFDLLVAAPALVLLSPVLLAAAIAIYCTSEGGIFFCQERVGRNQELFRIYKFRTMSDGAEFCGPSVTCADDPRITPVGRWLRRFKLDELPQLYNVLRGDMSLVGPRPKLAQHECMHMVCRPGITGAATLLFSNEEELLSSVAPDLVERYTVEVLNPVKAFLDTRYAQQSTLRTDLQLLASTLFRVSWNRQMADLAELVDLKPEDLRGGRKA